MKLIRQVVIMAAGRGQRMMPLTDVVPKPMAPLHGSTMIARSINKLRQRIPMIHVTVGYKGAMLAQHVIENGASSVFNTDGKPNCWWIYNTLMKNVDEPIFVLTCDNVVDLDFPMLEESYLSLGSPAAMIVPVKPVAGFDGDYIFRDGAQVTSISRTRTSDIYCSGVQILNPAKINQFTREMNDFYSVWDQLIAQKSLMVTSVYPKKWNAIDTLEQLAAENLTLL